MEEVEECPWMSPDINVESSYACAHMGLIYAKHTQYMYMRIHTAHTIIFDYNVIVQYDLNAMARHMLCVWLF